MGMFAFRRLRDQQEEAGSEREIEVQGGVARPAEPPVETATAAPTKGGTPRKTRKSDGLSEA